MPDVALPPLLFSCTFALNMQKKKPKNPGCEASLQRSEPRAGLPLVLTGFLFFGGGRPGRETGRSSEMRDFGVCAAPRRRPEVEIWWKFGGNWVEIGFFGFFSPHLAGCVPKMWPGGEAAPQLGARGGRRSAAHPSPAAPPGLMSDNRGGN